jgi:hypothetical protein
MANLTPSQQADLNRINQDNRNSGINRDMNPDYYLWVRGGATYQTAPPYYADEAAAESAQMQAARNQENALRAAKVAADQKALADSYAASQRDPNTTKGKSGKTAANSGGSKQSKPTTAQKMAANAKTPTGKVTVVKPATAQTNRGVIKGSSQLAKVNRVAAVKLAPKTTSPMQKAVQSVTKKAAPGTGKQTKSTAQLLASNKAAPKPTNKAVIIPATAKIINKIATDNKAVASIMNVNSRKTASQIIAENTNVVHGKKSTGGIVKVREATTTKRQRDIAYNAKLAGNYKPEKYIAPSQSNYKELKAAEKEAVEWSRQTSINTERIGSGNPLVSGYGKFDQALGEAARKYGGKALEAAKPYTEAFQIGESAGIGKALTEAQYKAMQEKTGIGVSGKKYTDFTNYVSKKLDNRLIISDENAQYIADTLRKLENAPIPTLRKISDKTGLTGAVNKVEKMGGMAPNVINSVKNIGDVLPETVLQINRSPKLISGALREAETLARNPKYIAPTAAFAVGGVIAGSYKGLNEDPLGTIATFAIQDAELRMVLKAGELAAKTVGVGSGLVRGSMHVVDTKDIIPLKERGGVVDMLMEQERVSGARSTPDKIGKAIKIRVPTASGEVINGKAIASKPSAFMTVKTGNVNAVSKYFLEKAPTSKVSKRIAEIDNVKTAKLPPEFKATIKKSIAEKGDFTEHYKRWEDIAQAQANKAGEPVAIPSPKAARGFAEQENEVVLIFPEGKGRTLTKNNITLRRKILQTAKVEAEEAGRSPKEVKDIVNATAKATKYADSYKIRGKRFAGIAEGGYITKKVSFGSMEKPSNVMKNVAENIKHNYNIGIDKYGLYNKADQRAYMIDALRREEVLVTKEKQTFGGAYEYRQHGDIHAKNVIKNLKQLEKENTLGISGKYAETLGDYHDVGKIGLADPVFSNHGTGTARGIRAGEFKGLNGLTKKELNKLADDIAYHDEIKPLNLRNPIKGAKTSLLYRPSAEAKALANADRMDLTRFDIKVDERQLFKLGDTATAKKIENALKNIESKVRESEFMRGTRAELGPVRIARKNTLMPKEEAIRPYGEFRTITNDLRKYEAVSVGEYGIGMKTAAYIRPPIKAVAYQVVGKDTMNITRVLKSEESAYKKAAGYDGGYHNTGKYNYRTTPEEKIPPYGSKYDQSAYTPAKAKYIPKPEGYKPKIDKYNPSGTYNPGKGSYTPPPPTGYTPQKKGGEYIPPSKYDPSPSAYNPNIGTGGYVPSPGGYAPITSYIPRLRQEEGFIIKKKKKSNAEILRQQQALIRATRDIKNQLGTLIY